MNNARMVVAVLDATCGPDGIGPRVPPGGLSAWTAHAAEHPAWVKNCADCTARRRESPFGGYGPSTGPRAWAWVDRSGGPARWVTGPPPAPCGVWCDLDWVPSNPENSP